MKWAHSFPACTKAMGTELLTLGIRDLHCMGVLQAQHQDRWHKPISLISPCSALAYSSLWTPLFSFHHHCTSRVTPQPATCQQESNRLARGSSVHLLWNFLACQALGLYNNKVKKSTVLQCQNKQNLKYVLLGKIKKSLGTEQHKGFVPEKVCPPTVLFLQMSPLKSE